MKGMSVRPATIREASAFVGQLHRHHGEPAGGKFALACFFKSKVVGYAIVGRPVARNLTAGAVTSEVTRLCTDGTKNACSFLYGASARVSLEMGYFKIITYILESESGASLKAAGWVLESRSSGGSWNRKKRPRGDDHPLEPKLRYSRILRPHALARHLDLVNLI